MKANFFQLVLPFCALLAASCAQQKEATADSGRPKTLADRVNERTGFTQDAEGNLKPLVNRRSQFEAHRDSPYFKNKFDASKQFSGVKDSQYGKKSWWGNKDYGLKEYAGNTDGSKFQKESKFGSQKSDLADKTSKFGDKAARDGDKSFGTKSAREADGKILDHPSDAAVDSRRRVFTPPSVIDWKEQRGLSVKDVKGILGKE